MNCCCKPKIRKSSSSEQEQGLKQNYSESRNVKHEVLLCVPGCKVHLMDKGEAVELANGDFTLERVLDDDVPVATIVKVGDDIQWPLTKDEPVVKIDAKDYLFSLPMTDGDPLSYGVTFLEQFGGGNNLSVLDAFLKENSCFSSSELMSSSSSSLPRNNDLNWKEFAPKIEDYNNVLARAIAGGTGQIVKGIFMCSNAYTNQVQRGGEMILNQPVEEKNGVSSTESKSNKTTNKSGINKNLKRVRKLSKMTEKMSRAMLDGVGIVTGSVVKPMVRSQAGKTFLAMVPGQVLLASLDAVNKIFDAAEVAEKQARSATSGAAKRMVSKRFGESAGEATEDVLATAGNCVGTAWNIFKIRKAINPASAVSSGKTGMLKNAAKSSKM